MTANAPRNGPSERTTTATGWFAHLADSIERGCLADAGEAQKELSKLGFDVRLKVFRPRQQRGNDQ
jgi:hypothetical protein